MKLLDESISCKLSIWHNNYKFYVRCDEKQIGSIHVIVTCESQSGELVKCVVSNPQGTGSNPASGAALLHNVGWPVLKVHYTTLCCLMDCDPLLVISITVGVTITPCLLFYQEEFTYDTNISLVSFPGLPFPAAM